MENEADGIRINKYFTMAGYCSRRAADKLIDSGDVRINGQVPEKGTKVMPGDVVTVNGKIIESSIKSDHVYIALHKPVGIVCTTDQRRERDNIVDFVNYPTRIFP
ncbi:MAG: S4 domain-containing protein, partial [Flavobacteriales bacterium]